MIITVIKAIMFGAAIFLTAGFALLGCIGNPLECPAINPEVAAAPIGQIVVKAIVWLGPFVALLTGTDLLLDFLDNKSESDDKDSHNKSKNDDNKSESDDNKSESDDNKSESDDKEA
ncbi:hypothetical protein N836_03760 [Leptolyngbya sp. Heron Island J]|uniref:hypothetical protein n=1 Tax=Leptolyngbya sp. Heron Island J TaxID=1385935 RepID=UPI0003B9CCB7|nr:hypothetical protein [Leptolyngbya sp. Heron Island J]ESA37282.1 hypothetical protein N836_03760 [Leptolyngbya sp. Heron Island J]